MLHIKYTMNFIMEQSTQTMEQNTTELEYISIYDKPKREKGRPKGSKYTDEEKIMRSRISTKDYYNRNIEKERERHILLYYQKKRKQKQILINKKMFIIFFRFIFF